MKLLIILTATIVMASMAAADTELTDDEIFADYIKKFKVPFRRRVNFQVVKENLAKRFRDVAEQNKRFNNGLESFNRTIYSFSHLSNEEFAKYHLGALEPNPSEMNLINETESRRGRMSEPPETSFQWSDKIVGRVKDQGQCGSCYAFAATSAIKSQRAVKYGGTADDYDLSEQDAMECTRGCAGGWDYIVYQYSKNYGGCAAYNYMKFHSYTGVTYSCTASQRPRVPQTAVKGYAYLQNDEKVIRRYLYNHGPLYTRFNVYENFYDYSSGVYEAAKGSFTGGHAVLFVGYGQTSTGKKYWILKNSWNTWWGENGFFKMARGINLCGIEGSVSVITDI